MSQDNKQLRSDSSPNSNSPKYKPSQLHGYTTNNASIENRSITQRSISKDREKIIYRHFGVKKNDNEIKSNDANYQTVTTALKSKNTMDSTDNPFADRSFSDDTKKQWLNDFDTNNNNNNNNNNYDVIIQTELPPKTVTGQQRNIKKGYKKLDESNDLSNSNMQHDLIPKFINRSVDSKDLLNNNNNNENRGMRRNFTTPALSKMHKKKLDNGLVLTPKQIPRSLSQNFANYKPDIVLSMLLELPYYGAMGLGSNLKTIIEDAIMEQRRIEKERIKQLNNKDIYKMGQNLILTDVEREIRDKGFLPGAPSNVKIPPTHKSSMDSNNDNLLSPPHIAIKDGDSNLEYQELDQDCESRIKKRAPSIEDFQQILNQGYTLNLIVAVIQGICAPFVYGYNISVFNVPQDHIEKMTGTEDNTFNLLNTIFCVGGLFGALSGGTMGDCLGRKKAMILLDILFVIAGGIGFAYGMGYFGNLVNGNDTNIETYIIFLISRFIGGVGAGAGTAIAPTYLGEISPPLIRGQIGAVNQLMITFGIVFSTIIGYEKILGGDNTWPYLVLIPGVIPILQLFTLWSFPESPKWLLQKGHELKARNALIKLRQTPKVDLDLQMMKAAITKSKSQNKLGSFNDGNTTVNEALLNKKNKTNRKVIFRATLIATMLMILQQLCGVNAIFFYSGQTLSNAGLTEPFPKWIGNCIINTANFFAVFIAVKLMDESGRKKLLFISGIGVAISSLIMSGALIGYKHESNTTWGIVVLAGMIIFVIFFELGLGPIPWLLTAEIAPGSHRGIIASFATFINWACNLGIAQASTIVIEHVYYFPFICVVILGLIFTKLYVPETKGKNEKQIQTELAESMK